MLTFADDFRRSEPMARKVCREVVGMETPFAVSEDGRTGVVYADKLFFSRECVLMVSSIYSEKYYISIAPHEGDRVRITLCEKQGTPVRESLLRSFMNAFMDYQVRLDLQKEFGEMRRKIVEYAFSPVK